MLHLACLLTGVQYAAICGQLVIVLSYGGTFIASFLLIMQPFEDNLLHANTLKPTVERFVLWRVQTRTHSVVNILFSVHLLD